MGYNTSYLSSLTFDKDVDKETLEFINNIPVDKEAKKYRYSHNYWNYRVQPEGWSDWEVTDNRRLVNDSCEKSYIFNQLPWLVWIVHRVIEPRGYKLNGCVHWSADCGSGDGSGVIVVQDNVVKLRFFDKDGNPQEVLQGRHAHPSGTKELCLTHLWPSSDNDDDDSDDDDEPAPKSTPQKRKR